MSSSAAAAPSSTTTLSTPGGMPAASAAAPNASDEIGVSGLGRRITELPASSAGTTFWNAMMMAALYGVMAATTPTGSWRRTLRATRPRTSSSIGTGLGSSWRSEQVEVDRRARQTHAHVELGALGEAARLAGLEPSSCGRGRPSFAARWSSSARSRVGPFGRGDVGPHALVERRVGPRRPPARPPRRASPPPRPPRVSSAGFSTANVVSPSTHRPATYERPGSISFAQQSPCRAPFYVDAKVRSIGAHDGYRGVDDRTPEVRRRVARDADRRVSLARRRRARESCR